MRKFLLVLSVISILFLAGCSKDVDNGINNENNTNGNIEIEEDNLNFEQEDKILDLNSEIAEEYLKIIEQYKNDEYSTAEIRYDLIYFNNDDVLDLVVGNQGYWVSVYLYDNGQIYNPVYKWSYGAMGNTGYDYIDKSGVILNYDSDYAGIIGTTSALILNSNFEFDTLSATRLLDEFLDENNEMYSEILNAYKEYGGFYYNANKITEEEYNEKMEVLLRNDEADAKPLMGTKLYSDILSLLEPLLNKEQENNVSKEDQIKSLLVSAGGWQPVSAYDVTNNKDSDLFEVYGSGIKYGGTLDFKEDGTFTKMIGVYGENYMGEYEIDVDKKLIYFTFETGMKMEGSYQYIDGQITSVDIMEGVDYRVSLNKMNEELIDF